MDPLAALALPAIPYLLALIPTAACREEEPSTAAPMAPTAMEVLDLQPSGGLG